MPLMGSPYGSPSFPGLGGLGGLMLPGMPPAAAPMAMPEITTSKQDKSGHLWDGRIDDAKRKWDCERDWREKYVKMYKDGRFPGAEKNIQQGANINLCFSYTTLVTALLAANLPVIQADPRRSEGDRAFAESMEKWLTYSFEETGSQVVLDVTIFDMVLRGLTWTKESFDPQRGMDVVDALGCMEVYVDPLARYHLGQARFLVQECTKAVEEAEQFFNRKLEPNFKLADQPDNSLALGRSREAKQANDKDLLRFYEIWERHADGRRTVSYRLHDRREWIEESQPWPFTLDGDEFPFTPWFFNTQWEGIDGFSEQQVVDALQREVNEMGEFDRRTTRKAAASKLFYRKDAIEEEDVPKLRSPDSLELIGCKAGVDLKDVAFIQHFTGNTAEQKTVYERNKQLHDEVLGYDELMRGANTEREMTKAEAEIREGVSMTRLASRQRAIDKSLTRMIRHRAQIARQLVDPNLVAAAIGPELAQAFALYAGDAADMVREFSIGIRAGSTGASAAKKEVEEAQETYEIAEHTNMTLMSFGQAPMYDMAKLSLELLNARKVRNPERFLLPPPEPVAVDPATGQVLQMGNPPSAAAAPAGPVQAPAPSPNVIPMQGAA